MGSDFLEVLVAEDISVGGIGVRIDREFTGYDLASEITLLVKLPGKHPFITQGKIRHKSSKGVWQVYGVQFTHLSPEHTHEIGVYVEQMLAIGRKACSVYAY